MIQGSRGRVNIGGTDIAIGGQNKKLRDNILSHKQTNRGSELEAEQIYELLKGVPSDALPPARLQYIST